MFKFFTKLSFIITGFALPIISFAQGSIPVAQPVPASQLNNDTKTATELFFQFGEIIQNVIPIIIGLAVLVFIWGVLQYVVSKEDAGKEDGKKYMLWGIIALFVMVSVWGLVNLLQRTIFEGQNPTQFPREEVDSLGKKPDIERASSVAASPLLQVLDEFLRIIEDAIPLVILLAVVVLLWGIFKYSFSGGGKETEKAKQIMLWGVIGLTVMAFLWAFVNILQVTVFKNQDSSAMGRSGDAVQDLQKEPEIVGSNEAVSASGIGINKPINYARQVISLAIPYLVSLGILLFLWGIFKYVISENPKEKSAAAQFMGWGLVMLLIMSFTWAFVRIIGDSVGINIESTKSPDEVGEKINVDSLIIKRK